MDPDPHTFTSKILQSVNIAMPYADSKTIVDKPTNGTSQSVIAAFDAFGSNVTFGEVVTFLDEKFQGEGLELEPTTLTNFPQSPAAFAGISDPYVKGFTLVVHNIWNLLIRGTNESRICMDGKCESSLIPLNHTFVIPGGRFREQCKCHPLRTLPTSHLDLDSDRHWNRLLGQQVYFGGTPQVGALLRRKLDPSELYGRDRAIWIHP
jgi:Trehalase